jgi:hypothetical protein
MASEQRLTGGGTSGNERLTAATGVLLLVLLAVIGVTIIRLGALLWVHLFVGMLLLPPVLLKMGSTGYRFARYYTANPAYREKGPPATPMRLLAPFVVISTVVVMGSGVALLFAGPSSSSPGSPSPSCTCSGTCWISPPHCALTFEPTPGSPARSRAATGVSCHSSGCSSPGSSLRCS